MADIILSVIIPVYNVDAYLERCVNSVLKQNIYGYEIILIDDGSTDTSGEICDRYQSQYNMIKVFHINKNGVSFARNIGLKNSNGKYLTFVDSDDMIGENTYQNNILYLEKHPEIEMLQYPTIWNYKSEYEHKDQMQEKQIVGRENIYKEWWRGDILNYSLWNKIYRHSVFDHIIFPEGHIFEDMYIAVDILKNINSVFISSVGCYMYRKREGSISSDKYTLSGILDLFEAHFRNYKMLCACSNLKSYKVTAFLRVYRKLLIARINFEDYMPTIQLLELHKYIPVWIDIFKSDDSIKEKILVSLIKMIGLKQYMSLFVLYMSKRNGL